MSQRTKLFQQLPWDGGINTSIDAGLIPASQLTEANNCVFDTRGSRKKRDGINHNWDDLANGANSVVGCAEVWVGATTKTQYFVTVQSNRVIKLYTPGNGSATTITLTDSGTAWSGTLTTASILTFNNKVFIAVDGSGNLMKMWPGSGSTVDDAPGTPPQASMLREHLGRILANDKTKPERLHYCQTGDHTQWGGVGDSGAFDIGVGDGDPIGLTGIFPSFKGDVFVGKKTKLYRITGDAPETMQVIKVSDGIGCASHNSIAPVDETDVLWVSDKGIHSLAASATYGDFTSTYVSSDIQRTFASSFDRTKLGRVWGAYLPQYNSVGFTFNETVVQTRTNTTTGVNNALWLYNIPLKAWYRWGDLPCQSMCVGNDSDQKRFYFGTHYGRLSRAANGTNWDVNKSGANVAVKMQITTGVIFPDNNPFSVKGFKRFVLYYTPKTTHHLAVSVKIDNSRIGDSNSLSFEDTTTADTLGSTFVLGTSLLGNDVVMGPYALSIDGIGRGFKVDMQLTGTNEDVEIQGFGVEYELHGTAQETSAT